MGHCISQVFFDGRWNLLDGDMGPFYLLRDNATIASEQDLVRDHDLLKRTHTSGILDPDSRAADEWSAALFLSESEWKGTREQRPGHDHEHGPAAQRGAGVALGPPGPAQVPRSRRHQGLGPASANGKVWGGQAADRICNGRWEYRPDFTREVWRKGAERSRRVEVEGGELVPEAGKTGTIVWKMRSPYPFVGGKLDVEGTGAKFSLSWDGGQVARGGREPGCAVPLPAQGRRTLRIPAQVRAAGGRAAQAPCHPQRPADGAAGSSRHGRRREPLHLHRRVDRDRKVRITHEWVERSLSQSACAPPAPRLPAGRRRRRTGPTSSSSGAARGRRRDGIADYHFELSDRPDLAWPLSANFEKLVSNTADRGEARYRLPYTGLLTPGQKYYWHVRARNDKGVWGPWSKTWSFTPGGLAPPVEVRLEAVPGQDGQMILRWKPNAAGRKSASTASTAAMRRASRSATSLHDQRGPLQGSARPGAGQFRRRDGERPSWSSWVRT